MTALLERSERRGDHPARLRLIVTDTSGNDQKGLLWGIRCRHYDSATTAQLFYEAEDLTPLNGAFVVNPFGASGGNVVNIQSLPTGSWVPMLSTNIATGDQPLTHRGSYRVWARACAANDLVSQLQLVWGVGSLSSPVTNDPVTLSGGNDDFYLLDLGAIRIDPPPIGDAQWFGVVQVYSPTGGAQVWIDCLYFQPLDDGAGQLTYVNEPPASSIATPTASPTAVANDASTGTVAWSNPTKVEALDGQSATVSLSSGQTSEWLKATGYGFSIPSGATIEGIQATLFLASSGPGQTFIPRLVKAGTVQAGSESTSGGVPYGSESEFTYGGPTDLWGGTWTPADINNSGFGFAWSVAAGNAGSNQVDYMRLQVWYTLASGFTVAQDAVIYANETLELRHDGMFRQGPSAGPYGPVSQVVGDLARIPPSGVEGRPVQIFIKPTRGDGSVLPDDGLDGFTVQAIYRPAWIGRP
jgi:hypothetical protein